MRKCKLGREASSVQLVVEQLEARCLLTTYYSLTYLGNLGEDARAFAVNSSD